MEELTGSKYQQYFSPTHDAQHTVFLQKVHFLLQLLASAIYHVSPHKMETSLIVKSHRLQKDTDQLLRRHSH